MLGTLDHRHVLALVEALANVDVQQLLQEVAQLAEQGPDFAAVLDELTAILHRLAVAQMVPDAVDNSHGDRTQIQQLAGRFTAEDLQLYYQIGIQGRGDMAHAPDLRSALEMTLLRMLAFRPQGVPKLPTVPLPLRREPAVDPAAQPPAVEPEVKSLSLRRPLRRLHRRKRLLSGYLLRRPKTHQRVAHQRVALPWRSRQRSRPLVA